MQNALAAYMAAHRLEDGSGEPGLILAVRADDVLAARTLLADGADPNILDSAGFSALAWAVRYHQTQMALLLLSVGADPNSISARPSLTLLMEASAERHLDLIFGLLAAGADPNLQSTPHLRTALMIAASHGHLDVVQILLGAGADCTLRDRDGNSALNVAEQALQVSDFLFPGKRPLYVEVVRFLTTFGGKNESC